MKRHASVMAPKFRAVLDILDKEIKPLGFASWNRPTGGYFISLNTYPGTAKRALALCQQAGVTMTAAGATFPYGIDPNDANIRVAPSLPPVEELIQAMEVFTTSLKLATLEKMLDK
jgi:DNA-binding transcriptional MocR family regulator